ncbi:5-carboxymethyl-2-hydroxymuconate Delta-isomerase [Mesorhizobium sp. CAU 1741]|uniref:5-carboxymethyl-2-hydroxymuconate Delta-isomerase n=1 Tax=Mesorhizobium sp. CAU 1741 TaxID=3140366 RepID=UPI00325BB867
MPHFTFEYSANLDDQIDVQGLCDATLEAALATGLFEVGAVRVRAIRCDHYAIADRLAQNAFLDLSIRVGAGRSPEACKQAGEAVFAAVAGYCAHLLEAPHFAMSVELREINAALSWKRNAMHARLRGS